MTPDRPAPSGKLYSAVTKHWPRIAAGLVATLGIVELVLGGLTADSGVEFYLMAWAGSTAGLWFLFEKAEKTLSDESRKAVSTRIRETQLRATIESIPDQFATLFDRVFGEKHLTLGCFVRSCVASIAGVAVGSALLLVMLVLFPQVEEGGGIYSWIFHNVVFHSGGLRTFGVWVLAAMALNLIPDYLSLLETRWILRRATSTGRFAVVLPLDFVLTVALTVAYYVALIVGLTSLLSMDVPDTLGMAATIGIPSTFFTSVWLWLYAASVVVSRFLVRMGGGVGFLLRVTDVERQPFRSIGFVSVIIVSGLFLVGLPLVLL